MGCRRDGVDAFRTAACEAWIHPNRTGIPFDRQDDSGFESSFSLAGT